MQAWPGQSPEAPDSPSREPAHPLTVLRAFPEVLPASALRVFPRASESGAWSSDQATVICISVTKTQKEVGAARDIDKKNGMISFLCHPINQVWSQVTCTAICTCHPGHPSGLNMSLEAPDRTAKYYVSPVPIWVGGFSIRSLALTEPLGRSSQQSPGCRGLHVSPCPNSHTLHFPCPSDLPQKPFVLKK